MIVYQDLKPKDKSYQKQVGTGNGVGKELRDTSKGPQLSRKWVLPPKSVRRVDLEGSGQASVSKSSVMPVPVSVSGGNGSDKDSGSYNGIGVGSGSGSGSGNGVTYAEKRRKQNREAQRAYRERKASKMQKLQQTIDFWKRKCESLQHESNVWKSRYESAVLESRNVSQAYESRLASYMRENSELRAKSSAIATDTTSTAADAAAVQGLDTPVTISHNTSPAITSGLNIEVQYDKNGNPTGVPSSEASTGLSKDSPAGHTSGKSCTICADGSCICDELELSGSSTSPGPTSFQDPLLQFTIDNWKPIKPVSIQAKRAGSVTPAGSTLPQFKRLRTTPVENVQPVGNVPPVGDVPPVGNMVTEDCGFCSESSTCVCREAANETACKQEPGSCSACQADSNSRKFCQNVVRWARGVSPGGQTEAEGEASGSIASASSSSISSASSNEYIPINDAFQRIKKHMKNSSNLSPNTINYDALALKGRKVQLKSVMDIINDMNKNFI
ncbi:hypothetical protein KLU848_4444 [Kluyveromyces marxianus]